MVLNTKEEISDLYKKMLLIRKVEEHIVEVYHTDAVKSPVHLSIGQEAVSVGMCEALQKDDLISNTYRSHGTYIAKGGNLNAMMAELYGKEDGCSGGKGGSMHMIDIESGVIGTSAIVGTTIPVSSGYALSVKYEAKKTGNQRVVMSLFGDGATEEGCFTETINFAALQNLPQIFVCENNRLAIHSPLKKRWASENICERMENYGLKTYKIPECDVFKIRDTAIEAVEFARKHSTPVFIECFTYRYLEHVGITDDHNENYRDQEEYRKWKDQDQIDILGKMLPSEMKSKIDKEVEDELEESVRFAKASKFPENKKLYTNVYA